eukprot:1961244-Ditylum_brightwellii.AAC.1
MKQQCDVCTTRFRFVLYDDMPVGTVWSGKLPSTETQVILVLGRVLRWSAPHTGKTIFLGNIPASVKRPVAWNR